MRIQSQPALYKTTEIMNIQSGQCKIGIFEARVFHKIHQLYDNCEFGYFHPINELNRNQCVKCKNLHAKGTICFLDGNFLFIINNSFLLKHFERFTFDK